MSKQVIFLFGPPGAGKGVQAELLSEKLGYYHFESSKVIEKCLKTESSDTVFDIEGGHYKVADEQALWVAGNLNSPPFVVFLMLEKIKELAADEKSVIFSGSPRSVYEAEREIPSIKELFGLKNIHFFLLEIKPETTIARNSNRRICELMRHSILFSKESENLTMCPLDGSKLVRRKGLDDPETIKNRLNIYRDQTRPVVKFMEKEGIKVVKIDGEKNVAEVHQNIVDSLS